MRILLKYRRYFKNFGGFSYILGVNLGILEDSWRIFREFRVGNSISHKALPEAFFAKQTEVFPDIFIGMKLPQDEGKDSACILALQ